MHGTEFHDTGTLCIFFASLGCRWGGHSLWYLIRSYVNAPMSYTTCINERH